jgi:hypothetical protein
VCVTAGWEGERALWADRRLPSVSGCFGQRLELALAGTFRGQLTKKFVSSLHREIVVGVSRGGIQHHHLNV